MGKGTTIGLYAATALVSIWVLAPVYWILNSSLQTEKALHIFPPNYFPKAPTTFAYYFLFHVKEAFQQWVASGEVV